MSFHTLFLISRFTSYSIFTQTGAWLPPTCSFIKSHDAILFCPSQGPISDCSAFSHFAHSPSHWRLHQGRGALCWLHNLGRVQYNHQGWPNEKGTPLRQHTQASKLTARCSGLLHCVLPDVFRFRSPTTTRPHRVFSPTSPQTSLASPLAFTAPFLPVAISLRPTRTAQRPHHSLPCDKTVPPWSPYRRSSSFSRRDWDHPSVFIPVHLLWRFWTIVEIWIQVSHPESTDVFVSL